MNSNKLTDEVTEVLSKVGGITLKSMSIINSLGHLRDFIGLHYGLALETATTEQRENQAALEQSREKLKELEQLCYANMIANMKFVAQNGWFYPVQKNSEEFLELQREKKLLRESLHETIRNDGTMDSGFILWLDYSKSSSKTFSSDQRPRLLPDLSAKNDVRNQQ